MEALHYYNGQWLTGNPPVIGAGSHAFWLGSIVFDGARSFDGVAPDLEAHCARTIRSARNLEMEPAETLDDLMNLAWDGISRFPTEQPLYIRPLFFAEGGFVVPEEDSARFCLTLMPLAMPKHDEMAVCLAENVHRPNADQAPVNAKASALYPNSWRELKRVQKAGFNNAVIRDSMGNVAELLTANFFIVKDGVAITPVANGCFLAGITRSRIMELLRADGIPVQEQSLTWEDVQNADEVFACGNYGKVQAITRIGDVVKPWGPITRRTRELYWDWALSTHSPLKVKPAAE